MVNANPYTIDPDMLGEYLEEMQEKRDAATQDLIELEHNPGDQDILNRLFRDVHTAKGNLALLNIDKLIPLFQGIEDILDGLRQGTFPFSTLLSDALLLSFDRAFDAAAKLPVEGIESIDLPHLNSIGEQLGLISRSTQDETQSQLKALITLIDPTTSLQLDQPLSDVSQASESSQQAGSAGFATALVERFNLTLDNDLLFFIGVARQMEVRSPYWDGRSKRMGFLALAMNEHANKPIVPEQLFCAVLLHDLGMAFQPLSLLHKEGAFTEDERHQIQSHVNVGFECLRRMADWHSAAQMILQHQERCDGSGYPLRLKGDKIDDGAKVLAIVDTFDACTHERAHTNMPNRPFMRAVLEINRHAGIALDQNWVDHFNQAVKNLEKNAFL